MKVLLALALAILGHSAHAGEFTLLIFDKPAELAKRTDPSASKNYWQSYNAYADLLVQAGVMRGGTALDENAAETIRGTTVMGGKACIRGMRVTVGMIVGQISAGLSVDEILLDYPYLEREDVMQALRYAAPNFC